MTDAHAGAPDLALYVMGSLEPGRARNLERHVVHCESCGAALAREARLEIALTEVRESIREHSGVRAVPRRRAGENVARGARWRAARVGVAGVAALAAAALFAFAVSHPGAARGAESERGRGMGSEQGAAVFACPDGADGAPCDGWSARSADASWTQ